MGYAVIYAFWKKCMKNRQLLYAGALKARIFDIVDSDDSGMKSKYQNPEPALVQCSVV